MKLLVEPLLPAEPAAEFSNGFQELIGSAVTQRLAFLCRSARPAAQEGDWPVRIVVFDIEESRHTVLADSGRHISWPIFSPQGDQIAFFSAPADVYTAQWADSIEDDHGYSLHVVDLDSGEERQIAPPNMALFAHAPPAWSPDGARLAFHAQFDREEGFLVHIVDATGQNLQALRASLGFEPRSVVWVDEETVLFHTDFPRNGTRGIYRMNLLGGEPQLIREANVVGPMTLSPDRRLLEVVEMESDGRHSERVLTPTGEQSTEDMSDLQFRGRWRLQSP